MGSVSTPEGGEWRQLDIAVIGGGIGGLCASISLRRAGHKVTIYERADFVGEVGASISCAVNGARWLHEWGVNVDAGRPVELKKLIAHNWKTGEVTSTYDLKDYKSTWGYVGFLRCPGSTFADGFAGILYVSSC
jgi:salicylate hydroxylase